MALSDPLWLEPLDAPLSALIDHARKAGADTADTVGTYGRSAAISVRNGELEDIENLEGFDIGLRVMVGQRQACVSSSDLSPAAIKRLAERAVAMAKLAPEDPYCGLAPEDRLSPQRNGDGLELFDPTELDPAALKKRALAVERAAMEVSGVKQAEGAQAGYSWSAIRFRTSAGFDGGYVGSRHSLSVSAIAERDGAMERDFDHHGTRWMSDLRTPEEIGRKAGERAMARLGATSMPSAALPVLFDRRVSASLIGGLVGAITGSAIARGVSFLKDNLGETLFPKDISIIENPLQARGLASRPFDGEGVETKQFDIIRNGQLTSWLLNSSAARQLDLETTGHAARGLNGPPGIGTSNVALMPGELSRDALIVQAGSGLLVQEMFGPSLNPTTGDYSVGVSGFAIEGGEVAHPVSEITIAGNLKDVFASLIAADDLHYEHEMNAPSVLVEGLTIAGQ